MYKKKPFDIPGFDWLGRLLNELLGFWMPFPLFSMFATKYGDKPTSVCPRSLGPIYIVSYYINLDIQYFCISMYSYLYRKIKKKS